MIFLVRRTDDASKDGNGLIEHVKAIRSTEVISLTEVSFKMYLKLICCCC